MMIGTIAALLLYAFFQIRFYAKNGNKKEIAVFLGMFFISVFYLIGFIMDLELIGPEYYLIRLYDPIAKLLFGNPK